MKKLLALLSATVFTASSAITAAACSSEEKRTDSIFIAGNGDFKITSASLLDWYKSWNGFSSDNVKFINKLYNLIAVGILDGVAKGTLQLPTSTEAQKRGWDDSLNDQIKNLLGTKDSDNTSTLYGLANRALKDLKENTHKNKFNDYKKDLEKRFPGVRNNIKDLENAFKSDYILNDSTNSAFVRLKNLLMFNSTVSNSLWRKGIQTVKVEMKTITSEFASAYNNINSLENLAKKVEENFKKAGEKSGLSWSDKSITSFTNLVNSLGGVGFGDKKNSNENISISYSSSKDVQTRIKETHSSNGDGVKNGQDWIKEILQKITPDAKSGSVAFANWTKTNNYVNDSIKGPQKFINYNNNTPRSWSEIVDQIPSLDGQGNLAKDLVSGSFGSITDSQKYSLDRYFTSEKPVMVSDLVFTFANSKNKDSIQKELSLKSLIPVSNSGSDLTKELIERFQGIGAVLSEYVKNDKKTKLAGLTRFDTIFRGDTKHLKANLTNEKETDFSKWTQWDSSNTYHKVNKTGSLLTVSESSFSDVTKYSIYDFMTNTNNNNNWSWNKEEKLEQNMLEKGGLTTTEAKNVLESLSGNGGSKEFAKSAIANLIKLFDKINQRNMPEKDENKMFTTLNKDEGIIAYIDGDGLHITKIDGYALTNNNSDSSNTNEEINTIEQTKIIKTIESLYSSSEGKELVPYLVNSMINTSNNNDTTDTSGWTWAESDKQRANAVANLGIDIDKLNNNIRNNYERFLVNTSLVDSTRTTAFYNTNILNEAAKATETKSDSLATQANWILNFFTKVFNKANTNEFFLSIVSNQNDSNGQNIDLITKMLTEQSRQERFSGVTTMFAKNQEWIQNIKENFNNQSKDVTIDKNFIPNYGINLSSKINQKTRFEMLLDSKLFDPISNLKNQNKTDMPSTPRGDMPSALRLARIGEDK
ncbi:lipoprotein [Mycoplasma putrefaciens]|uniref:lipoprotein n=1 Tax=Mycoplasma putrefaciens TaxID=2123 RepID=UPI003DA65ECA